MPFTVTYNGNGSDGGTVPVDSKTYNAGDTVSVQAAGSMTKTGATFAYWNTKADGTGTFHGWPQDTTFKMPAANVTLYAQWFVTTGLANGGATTHYKFSYDSSLSAGGLEPGRTQTLMNAAEGDYNIMATWFKGVTPSGPSPIPVYVTRLNGGANNTGDIRLKPNTNSPNELRCYLVSEVTESFMSGQNKGWGFLPGVNDEESCGEGLSLFLTQQFALSRGFASPYTSFTANTANGWLNSSLPSSNPASTRYVKNSDGSTTDFGSRFDYVNSVLPYPGNGPGTGCSILFIYYLYHQLGFTIPQIIAAAPGYDSNNQLKATAPLRGVYQNLTGDNSDPFPFFKQLLDTAYPPDQVSSIPGVDPDDPWPLASLQYWGVKNTFGKDEVNDLVANSGGIYTNGFSLALEGFNRQVLGGANPATPTISFGGVTCRPSGPPTVVYQFSDPRIPQRVLFNYDIHFDGPPALGTFPTTGETAVPGNAQISVLGQTFSTETEFFFLAGADPYFVNVLPNLADPASQNVPWMSQDLRVFTVTPGLPGGQVPVPSPQYLAPPQYPVPPGAPTFFENRSYGDYDVQGAYNYITDLVDYLNKHYGDPSKVDPFDVNNSLLPGQKGAFTGDSSVTPGTYLFLTTLNNYNFAIARVRLRGSAGPAGAAKGVKVFFRTWQTQTADTDWNPGYTYLSDDPTGLNPQYPKAPMDNHTIPFFATGNYPVTNDAPNNQDITINQGDKQWAYFGCFLNLYDRNFNVNGQSVQQQFAQGTHHCIVAEIAFKDAPIRNTGGSAETTETSDQLAQRNLQVTTSANPGDLATHRVPQTFDIKRSDPATLGPGVPWIPDELMFNWGNTPAGSIAKIYWPGADAAEILSIASRIYGAQVLSAYDNHTVQCTTVHGVTYVPIPPGTGEGLAGLLTIDLPANVVKGQEFNIVVRRIGSRRVGVTKPPPPPPPPPRIDNPPRVKIAEAPTSAAAAGVSAVVYKVERYVVGSFQVKIPVKTKEDMLPAEENTLAIFKARLKAMSPTNRWRPVIERYIDMLSARVDGLGGDAKQIPPSFLGNFPRGLGEGGHEGEREARERWEEHTGKVGGLIFDHFGDFEGFILDAEEGERRYFSRETEVRTLVERVWRERLRITVLVERDDPSRPRKIIVREPPAQYEP
jgi:Listeria-Bacteroides repeat domain (List_Bact_rpt)